eukprot:jgi/Botrbrau1/10351/Bobra.0321s0026.1
MSGSRRTAGANNQQYSQMPRRRSSSDWGGLGDQRGEGAAARKASLTKQSSGGSSRKWRAGGRGCEAALAAKGPLRKQGSGASSLDWRSGGQQGDAALSRSGSLTKQASTRGLEMPEPTADWGRNKTVSQPYQVAYDVWMPGVVAAERAVQAERIRLSRIEGGASEAERSQLARLEDTAWRALDKASRSILWAADGQQVRPREMNLHGQRPSKGADLVAERVEELKSYGWGSHNSLKVIVGKGLHSKEKLICILATSVVAQLKGMGLDPQLADGVVQVRVPRTRKGGQSSA